ncbi:HEAT repeat domain-containing protein [Pseudomonas putida]
MSGNNKPPDELITELAIAVSQDNAPILDIPEPPADLRWAEVEDFQAREVLKANGVVMTEQALLSTLECSVGALKVAAAHTLGSLGYSGAIAALQQLVEVSDDMLQVEAAFALVRLGREKYRSKLTTRLQDPVNAYLGPIVAAGDLARLGDPIGYSVIARCFDENNLIVRVVASKQLLFFAPFHGERTIDGQPIDAYGLFDRALHDSNPDVQWSALVQLRELQTPDAYRLLAAQV